MAQQKKAPIAIAASVNIASVFVLVSCAVSPDIRSSAETFLWILGFALLAIGANVFLILAIACGWFSLPNTRRRPLADLAHEFFPSLLRPFCEDVWLSMVGRQAVGFWGVVLAFLITTAVLRWWPDHSSLGEKIGIGLGIAGLIFGILGYHVAFRVEKSIRGVVSDFRQFLKEVADILEHEIVREKSDVKKFPPVASSTTALPEYADLICVLWFPYYGLTRDFNHIGENISHQLGLVQELACRTYFITAKDPLTFMEHFDCNYKAAAKTYDKAALDTIAAAIRGKSCDEWEKTIKSIATLNWNDAKVGKVKECVKALHEITSGENPRFWTAKVVDNDELMNGMVQLVWTPKKAVIVFMPPEKIAKPGGGNQTIASLELSKTPPKDSGTTGDQRCNAEMDNVSADAVTSYKCSGFVTEDPHMTNMIRELVRIRFQV